MTALPEIEDIDNATILSYAKSYWSRKDEMPHHLSQIVERVANCLINSPNCAKLLDETIDHWKAEVIKKSVMRTKREKATRSANKLEKHFKEREIVWEEGNRG